LARACFQEACIVLAYTLWLVYMKGMRSIRTYIRTPIKPARLVSAGRRFRWKVERIEGTARSATANGRVEFI
jgi:hypothetical protein